VNVIHNYYTFVIVDSQVSPKRRFFLLDDDVGGAKRNVADKVFIDATKFATNVAKRNEEMEGFMMIIGEEDNINLEDDFYNQDLLLYDVA